MISFKSFITTVHDAILKANDALMDKNVAILDRYFVDTVVDKKDTSGQVLRDDKGIVQKQNILVPRSVLMQYPNKNEDGSLTLSEVHVPLITLVPLATSQIEKATLVADFEIELVNDEVQLNFGKSEAGMFKKSKVKKGRLEVVISPQETSEGLKLMVDGYESILRRQIT